VLAAIVASSEDAIISKDLTGRIVSWNQAATRLLGYAPEEIVGESILRLIPEKLHLEEPVILAKIGAGERIEHFETVRVRKGGELLEVSLSISPVRDEKGTIVGASKILRDISSRKRAEQSLLQAEKVAATGRMAATIAHEINNPLEAVTNLLYLLRETKSADDRAGYLALAEEEIKRVSEIATQTLRFYRDPAGPTVCDLPALVESVLTIFHGRAHLLQVEPEMRFADGCQIYGSQGELRQVFVNLVGNALDAMPSGGRLLVRACVHQGEKSGVRATVADTGEGMSAETQARLFRPFFTTKSSTGTGLGLWLSLEILNKHGASIRVRSRRGTGTAISVFFPERAREQADMKLG
jgi:PAS domain S-box-containing protein